MLLITTLMNHWRALNRCLNQGLTSHRAGSEQKLVGQGFAWCPASASRAQPMQMAADKERSLLGIRISAASCPLRKSKQQKLAEREQELLNLAEDLINQEGFATFTMDKLAAASGYSKGTMYNHFSGKEDCLAGLCIRGMGLIEELFNRAIAFNGTPREKILALNFAYQLYGQLQPTLSLAVLTARTPAFAEKTSPERSALMQETDMRITLRVYAVFQQAIQSGELTLPPGLTVEAVSFMCWAQAFGGSALLGTARDLTAVSRISSLNMPLLSANVMLDGLGFRPLSADWDYSQSWERIGHECFAQEQELLNKN